MDVQATIVVSSAAHPGSDAVVLADLMFAYHRQTEAEKGTPVTAVAELPERYRREVEHPGTAFRGQTMFLAMIGSVGAGCAVMTAPRAGGCELKRLWTDPAYRGRGVASRLIEAAAAQALELGANTMRLTVWQWRVAAIDLYERLGFVRSTSWDEREGLVCMQRSLARQPG